jgi:hypothetical protein
MHDFAREPIDLAKSVSLFRPAQARDPSVFRHSYNSTESDRLEQSLRLRSDQRTGGLRIHQDRLDRLGLIPRACREVTPVAMIEPSHLGEPGGFAKPGVFRSPGRDDRWDNRLARTPGESTHASSPRPTATCGRRPGGSGRARATG